MHSRRRRQDIAGLQPGVTTGPVADPASQLEHQGGSSCDVPGAQAQLEEAVEGATGRPAQVERCGTSSPQVFEMRQCTDENGHITRDSILASKGETGGNDGGGWIPLPQRRQPFTIEGRSQAPLDSELDVQPRPDHNANLGLSILEQRHRHADDRQCAREVRGSIERVDGPARTGRRAAPLLGQDGDPRCTLEENFNDGILTGVVGVGDVVT